MDTGTISNYISKHNTQKKIICTSKSSTKIFTLKKHHRVLKIILTFLDYGEMITMSNISREVFQMVKKMVDIDMIKTINRNYLGADEYGNNRKITNSLIEQIINYESFNLDEVFLYFAFLFLKNFRSFVINLTNKDLIMLNIIKKFQSFFSQAKITNFKFIINNMEISNYRFLFETCLSRKLSEKLEVLSLNSNDMTDNSLGALISLIESDYTVLKDLTISCKNVGADKLSEDFLTALENNVSLKSVNLTKCAFSARHVELVKKVFYSHGNKIHNLTLEDNNFEKKDVQNFFENFKKGMNKSFLMSFERSPFYLLTEKTRRVNFERTCQDDHKIPNPEDYYNEFILDLKFEELGIHNFTQELVDYEYIFNFILQDEALTSLCIDLNNKSDSMIQKCLLSLDNCKFAKVEVKDYVDNFTCNNTSSSNDNSDNPNIEIEIENKEKEKENYLIKILNTIKNKYNIKEVVLENVRESKERWLDSLVELINLNSITGLTITNSSCFKNNEITILAYVLNENTSLRSLNLKNCGYNNNGAEFLLNRIKEHSCIQSIVLNENLNKKLLESFEEVCLKNLNAM